jgi:UDP-N-acetylmuramyl pentapeptide synthase
MSINLKNLISVLDAKWIGPDTDIFIDHISIDSRSLQNGSKTLFFALSGINNDAHLYIPELIEKGVQNFVVHHIPKNSEGKANFLVVKNTLKALQQFASYYRDLFDFPVIGLTGSNGKTIVKEWLNFLLSPDYNVIRSPKSYNSQVGVPLSVIAINEKHNLGIFEAGISTVNEMSKLENIVKPTIGVLTNIGPAHDEGFENSEQKIREKLLLFKKSEVIVYQKNELVDFCLKTFCESNIR